MFKTKHGSTALSVSWVFIVAGLTVGLPGCGGGGSSTTTMPPPSQSVTLAVTSSSSSVLLGDMQQLTAKVTGTPNTAVSWSVNGVSGGNSTVGTISNTGLYTAPQVLPNAASVTIQATSQANSSVSANTVLTITSDIRVNVATSPSIMSSVFPGGTVQLLAPVMSDGQPDPNVSWAVNGVTNGNSTVGSIAVTGLDTALYTAPNIAPNPNSVNITAVCVADSSKSGKISEAIQPCTLNGTIGYLAPPAYVPPSASTCDVSDVSTLNSCVAAVRSGAIANVRFTAMVNCSGNGTCLVDLTNVHGPVVLFGAPGISSGFLRTDTYTYPILNISGASGLTIANLTFDEGPDDPACTPYQANGSYVYPCQSTIEIDHSSDIVLKQVSILHSKDHAIAFSATQGITIQDSQIQDAGVFGIWSGSNQSLLSGNVSITNNLIQDVKSNGIFLSFTQNTTISSNTLQHNHHVALFNDCNGLCSGGQIDMQDNSSLQISSNEIRDGQIDLNNATGQTDGSKSQTQMTTSQSRTTKSRTISGLASLEIPGQRERISRLQTTRSTTTAQTFTGSPVQGFRNWVIASHRRSRWHLRQHLASRQWIPACAQTRLPASASPEVQVASVIHQDTLIHSEWVATLDGHVNAQIQL